MRALAIASGWVALACALIGAGYASGISHGRDSRDLAGRLEGHINYLIQVSQCQ